MIDWRLEKMSFDPKIHCRLGDRIADASIYCFESFFFLLLDV